MLITVFLAFAASAASGVGSCDKMDKNVCLTPSRVGSTLNTSDPAACCAACHANATCVAWNVNFKHAICFLRPEHIAKSGSDPNCVSGLLRPPAPPAPPWQPNQTSDQRPRFHAAPTRDSTNDVQGPFYDPRHGLYHLGFAWHVNGTHGIGSAPNRWWHQVSRDLARWQIVSTTPGRAMLSPGPALYDDLAVMTGSVSVVNGTPAALYSCRGSENKGKGWSSATVALATPADLSDPLLLSWAKSAADNPVLNPGFKPGGMPKSGGFRDPSSVFESAGQWRMLAACQNCNGSGSMLGLFSSLDLHSWTFTSTPLMAPQLECPDLWPVILLGGLGTNGHGSAAAVTAASAAQKPLTAIKLSTGGKEVSFVGTWDDATQTLVDVLEPLVTSWPRNATGQLLDAATYASKSFYDPVHRQQVWTSWVHEKFKDESNGCINRTVCNTHTLLRALVFDPELRAHVTPPVPQTALLRKAKLYELGAPTQLAAGSFLALPPAVEASGMQLEIEATFALPAALPAGSTAAAAPGTIGVSVRRSRDLAQRTDTYITVLPVELHARHIRRADDLAAGYGAMTLQTAVDNANALRPGKPKPYGTAPLPFATKPSDANVTLRVFVDHSVVESYAQGGRAVATARTYPTDDALGAGVFCNGTGATLLSLVVYSVDEIWVDKV